MSSSGVPRVSKNNSINHLSIQPSDVAQMEEENRLLEESLTQDSVGLTVVQFFPPSPDGLIGGNNNSSEIQGCSLKNNKDL